MTSWKITCVKKGDTSDTTSFMVGIFHCHLISRDFNINQLQITTVINIHNGLYDQGLRNLLVYLK